MLSNSIDTKLKAFLCLNKISNLQYLLIMKANYIEFYFDCSSPWTYLAFKEILPLSKRQNLEIIWKPILVGGVFNLVNEDVYSFRKKPNPLKLSYANNDLNLWSKIRSIQIKIPDVFPVNSVRVMRGCLFANRHKRIVEFSQNAFQSYWTNGNDISKDIHLYPIAESSGLNLIEFKKFIESSEAKNLLKKNTEELIQRGGFGSPTFFYKNHMFFGNDRLALFENSFKNGLLD